MFVWFRRTRPTTPVEPDFSERYIAALNGFTPEQWETLPHYDEPAPDLLNSTRPTKAEER